MLAALDLEFLGFELGEQHGRAYSARFPEDTNRVNLDNWHEFEREQPRMFLGMYQFHVMSKARAMGKRAA